jgi:hypothetical protein
MNCTYLINVENIGPSIPSPIPHLCAQLPETLLNDFTRTILSEEAEHRARAWSAIQPYRKLIRGIARADKPEKCVRRVVTGHMDPSCILLLVCEGSFAYSCVWNSIGNTDIAIYWRQYRGNVRRTGWELSECDREEKGEEEEMHGRSVMVC